MKAGVQPHHKVAPPQRNRKALIVARRFDSTPIPPARRSKFAVPIGLAVVVSLYLALAFATLLAAQARHTRPITGDEPHYLVMARGLVVYGTLEQTQPYRDAFATRAFFPGWPAAGTEPTPQTTHAVVGPHGLYNVHNIGLPALIAIPYAIGGVFGVHAFLILCSALIVVLAWKITGVWTTHTAIRLWSVVAVAVALPFLPASSQIYPDLLAGVIALLGCYWFMTAERRRALLTLLGLATVVAFLPWLQLKFAPACALLVVAIIAKSMFSTRSARTVIVLGAVSVASFVALALYNRYAFGQITGPYQTGALVANRTSLMVLLGLHYDQNQGLLLQNPLALLGVVGIGWMTIKHRVESALVLLVFASLIVFNAMHPAWYGAYSFSGRFAWSAAAVFVVPTLYALVQLGERRPRVFGPIVAASVLVQSYFFVQYAVLAVDLYNRTRLFEAHGVLVDSYSVLFYPLQRWLPAFTDPGSAFHYGPNLAWAIVLATLLIAGFVRRRWLAATTPYLAIGLVAGCFVSGLFTTRLRERVQLVPRYLPSEIGAPSGTARVARPGSDRPGFLTFGPFLPMRAGTYRITLTYTSDGDGVVPVGTFDVAGVTDGPPLATVPIPSTNGVARTIECQVTIDQWNPELLQFRTSWNGTSTLTVQSVELQSL